MIDPDSKLVSLILRLHDKVNDCRCDINKVCELSLKGSFFTQQEKQKVINLSSKFFELQTLINKLLCP